MLGQMSPSVIADFSVSNHALCVHFTYLKSSSTCPRDGAAARSQCGELRARQIRGKTGEVFSLRLPRMCNEAAVIVCVPFPFWKRSA
jgi:hypothetical protein